MSAHFLVFMLCKYVTSMDPRGLKQKLDFMVPENFGSPFKSAKIVELQVAFDFHCHH